MKATTLSDQAKHILGGIEAALAWWFRELAAWLDEVIKHFGPMLGRSRLVARTAGDEIEIQELQGEGQVAIDRLTRLGKRSATAPLERGERPSGAVEFLLDERDVLSGEVELPSATAANIRQALSFQLPRLLPLESNDIFFGATILSNDAARGRVTVGYAVARKELIERLCKALESNGYRPSKIIASASFSGSVRQIEIERAAHGRLFSLPLLSHPLTGVAAVAAALLFAVVIGQLRESQILAAAEQSEAARQKAGGAISLAQRAAALRTTAQEIAALRQAPMIGALLNDLAAHTPDDAHFDKLTISDNVVRISGYAVTAASVLAELGHSKFLDNIAFATPVVVDSGTGKERFDIRASLVTSRPEAPQQ